MNIDKKTRLFIILGGFFIANALVAEFIGSKLFSLENSLGLKPIDISLFGIEHLSFNLTCGVLLWPMVFVMTDIINEYYGKQGVKLLSYLAAGLIAYTFVMVYLAMKTHPFDLWENSGQSVQIGSMQVAYNKVFGQGLWIIIGSLVAFLIGQMLDVWVFHWIKLKSGEKYLWLRSTGSTLISQLIDSFVVLIIAFYIGNNWPLKLVLAVGIVNYIYKFTVAMALTPVLYILHNRIDKYLGIEQAQQMTEAAAQED